MLLQISSGMTSVGDTIRKQREKQGLTLEQLSATMQMSITALANREVGKTRIKPSDHEKFADAFGISIEEFDEQCIENDEKINAEKANSDQPRSMEVMDQLYEAFKILQSAGENELALAQLELLAKTFMLSTSDMKSILDSTNPKPSSAADQS